jgi:two-component system, cell cycle response regulator DivK
MSAPLILIVEDDPNSRKLLRDVLGAVGYQTREADNGEDGVRLASETLPAVILMDIRLPGISGIEALKLLRGNERTRSIPVVAVTASVMQVQTALLFDAGFDDLEQKPVKMAALLEKVRRLLPRNAVAPVP